MSHSNESFHTFENHVFLPVSIFFFSLEENLKIIKNLFLCIFDLQLLFLFSGSLGANITNIQSLTLVC